MLRQRWARASALMTVLSTRAGGGDHGAAFAGVTTVLLPPTRRIEMGILTIIVRGVAAEFWRFDRADIYGFERHHWAAC